MDFITLALWQVSKCYRRIRLVFESQSNIILTNKYLNIRGLPYYLLIAFPNNDNRIEWVYVHLSYFDWRLQTVSWARSACFHLGSTCHPLPLLRTGLEPHTHRCSGLEHCHLNLNGTHEDLCRRSINERTVLVLVVVRRVDDHRGVGGAGDRLLSLRLQHPSELGVGGRGERCGRRSWFFMLWFLRLGTWERKPVLRYFRTHP